MEDYDTVLNYINTTRTKTGLKVTGKLNTKTYLKGEEASDQEMQLLRIRRHNALPQWNYRISPQNQK